MRVVPIVLTLLAIASIANAKRISSRTTRLTEDNRIKNGELTRSKRFIGSEEAISIVATLLELWDLVDNRLASNEISFGNFSFENASLDLSFLNRKQAMLTAQILGISKQLDRMESSLAYSVDYTIDSILTAVPKLLRAELRLHDLKSVINQINLQDKEMQRYLTNQSAIERHTLEDWALAVSSHHRDSIRNLMGRLHTDVNPAPGDPYKKSVFKLIREGDSKSSICELQQSQQELIYQLYNMVALAELKGYTMLQFAWMLLKIYEKGTFTTEAELMHKLYRERTLQKVNAAREAMAGADRSLYRCDPKTWIEGENYVRLTKLLQGYIENEVNLNPHGTCGQNCKYYTVAQYHGCFKQQFCAQQRPCQGQVLKCTYYDSDMNICKSSSEDRRYDWVEYENHKLLGKKDTCPSRNLFKVDSWWRYLFWHCSYCFCLCDDTHSSSDRFFSLRNVTSDVVNNKVITGVRFQKVKQVIHIQIQQSRLNPRGIINVTEADWVPVKEFSVMDEDVEDGVDFHTMNYRERGVDLDDVFAPSTHVLTGLRFRKVGNHINLEILTTPFDFATGKLRPLVESLWIGNDNTDGSFVDPRGEVKMGDPDVPIKRNNHLPDSKHDQYILFRESSLSGDVAQSTVPYIDAQPIESRGLALSGLGLHHRGAFNSGGVIALKLITFDFSTNMVPETPEEV